MKIKYCHFDSGLEMWQVSQRMLEIDPFDIAEVSWPDKNPVPEVKARLAWDEKNLIVRFDVKESDVVGHWKKTNDSVYEDSCVECFIQPAGSPVYYNIEFNCIGTILMGHATSRRDRQVMDSSIIEKIRTYPSLGKEVFESHGKTVEWNLTAVIPLSCFVKHEVENRKGSRYRMNLYKCGDKCGSPHWIAWKKILTDVPDFHRPDFFGDVELE